MPGRPGWTMHMICRQQSARPGTLDSKTFRELLLYYCHYYYETTTGIWLHDTEDRRYSWSMRGHAVPKRDVVNWLAVSAKHAGALVALDCYQFAWERTCAVTWEASSLLVLLIWSSTSVPRIRRGRGATRDFPRLGSRFGVGWHGMIILFL